MLKRARAFFRRRRMLAPRPRTFPRARRAPRVTTGGALCPPRRRARRRGTRASREDRPDARPPRTCTPRRRARGDPRARAGRAPRHPRRRLRSRRRRRGRWRHARSPPRRGSSWTSSVGPRRRGLCFASAPPGPSPPRTGDVQGRAQPSSSSSSVSESALRWIDPRPTVSSAAPSAEDSTPKSPGTTPSLGVAIFPVARETRVGECSMRRSSLSLTRRSRFVTETLTLRTRRVSTSEKCKLPTHPTQLQDTSPWFASIMCVFPRSFPCPHRRCRDFRDPAPSRASRRVRSARRAMPPSFSRSASDSPALTLPPTPPSRVLLAAGRNSLLSRV